MSPGPVDPQSWAGLVAALRKAFAAESDTEITEAWWRGVVKHSGSSGYAVPRTADGEEREFEDASGIWEALRSVPVPEGTSWSVDITAPRTGEARVRVRGGSSDATVEHDAVEVQLAESETVGPFSRPAPHDTSAPAGPSDPEAVAAFVRERLPGAVGATEAELAEIEAAVGEPLPTDLRAFFGAATSGDLYWEGEDGEGDFYGMAIVTPATASDAAAFTAAARSQVRRYPSATAVEPTRLPPYLHDRCVPIGHDWGGNIYAVDLAPGPGGTVGQVVYFWHEQDLGSSLVAESLSALCAGEFAFEDYPDETNSVIVRDEADLATPLPESTEVVRCAAPVDLAGLAGLPNVWMVSLEEGTSGLDVLSTLPTLTDIVAPRAVWEALIASDLVPPKLEHAVVEGDDDETLDIAAKLLHAVGREPFTEAEITV